MSTALAHTGAMTARHLRALWRQPWYVAISLVQPVIWLLLFGALFERVVDVPGFGDQDYNDFLVPGIVVMTAVFSGGWLGAGVLQDLERGVIDRLLVSPARRVSLIAGPLAHQAVVAVIQSVIVVLLAVAVGARFPGGLEGVGGIALLILSGTLLAAAVGALSCALALVARQEETLIGVVQFVVLPLTFLSSALMAPGLLPGWVREVARFNPVDWAVVVGREAISESPDWSLALPRLAGLAALMVACGWIAVRAFRSYQRSV
ncbi:MAG: ABC transporter permease [Thermoleophilia bacterium]